ncbi:MAG: NADPH-dependent F420 reductase [Bryobacteraceae bacterium]
MNIGILGSGNVGGTLGSRWALAGHQVVFGTRDADTPEMRRLTAKAGATARAAALSEAARQDVLLLATPWAATRQVLESLGGLSGKVLIDATNPLRPAMDGLEVGTTTSGAEQVARWAAGATVVKAFNTVGFNIMADPGFEGGQPVLFVCGDDDVAKQTAIQLAADLGFEGVNAGPLTQARLLEPMALLWISLALSYGLGRDIAFRLLRR